jgi:hypothetical protein
MTIELDDIRYIGKSGQFGASSVHVNNHQKTIGINLKNVAVDRMQVDEASGNVFADGVSWQSGDVAVNIASLANNHGTDAPTIQLLNVHGANTPVHVISGGKQVNTTLENISFTELAKKPGSKFKLEGLDITGKQLQLNDKNLRLFVAGYDITDNSPSTFRQLSYKNNTGKVEASVSIPSLTAIPHIQAFLNGDVSLDAMNISNPVFDIHLHPAKETRQENAMTLPGIKVNGVRMTQPVIHFTAEKDSGLLSLNWQGEKNPSNFLEAKELAAGKGKTLVRDLSFYLTDFVFSNPKGKAFNTGEGKIAAQVKSIRLEQEKNQPLDWEVNLSHVDARDFRLDSIGKANGSFVMKSGIVENLHVDSSAIINLRELAAANRRFQLKQFTGHYYDNNRKIEWSNAGYDRNNNTLSLDSFFLRPTLEKDSFIAHQDFQADYMTFRSGAASIGPVDLDALVKDNRIKIGTASFDKFLFTDYKDKQLPFNPGIIKLLPTGLLKKIPREISVDLLQFTHAQVDYTETGEKTKKPATIPITRMTVQVQNARNFNTGPTDSLTLQATGYVMDSLWVRMKIKEAYWDSLGGFLMTVHMKSADLRILNPVLMPLAMLKIQSGYLDTLSMRAVGREYLALGEMKMLYHDLKVRVLKNGDSSSRSFLTGLANLVIKNNNSSRTGNVFFIRKRDRSAINYLVKIAMSGISSSLGVKGNGKMIRKYKKELAERKLPPIDFD